MKRVYECQMVSSVTCVILPVTWEAASRKKKSTETWDQVQTNH